MTKTRLVSRIVSKTRRALKAQTMTRRMFQPAYAAALPAANPSNQGDKQLHLALVAAGGLVAATALAATLKEESKTPFKSEEPTAYYMRQGDESCINFQEKYDVQWRNCVGEGSFASVYSARIRATGEKVALKKISKRFTSSKLFQKETQTLLRIQECGGHSNIAGLRDLHEDDDYYYLVFDFVKGGELFDQIVDNGTFNEKDAARIMHELASALAFLHNQAGVVHADLKPENLLLVSKNRRDGRIKIIDFGSAIVENAEQEQEEESQGQQQNAELDPRSSGTIAYWPPERFAKGTKLNAAMDMWGVGIILYIMLFGGHPFDEEGDSPDEIVGQRIQEGVSSMADDLVGLSEPLVDLLSKLMERDPEKRMTATEMLEHPWVKSAATKTATRTSLKLELPVIGSIFGLEQEL